MRGLTCCLGAGSYEGMTISDPKFRALFTRESIVSSAW